MIPILIINSLLVGFIIGKHYADIAAKVHALYDRTKHDRKKNMGVVRPGVASLSTSDTSNTGSKSAVVRPRPPMTQEDITNETRAAARRRVGL